MANINTHTSSDFEWYVVCIYKYDISMNLTYTIRYKICVISIRFDTFHLGKSNISKIMISSIDIFTKRTSNMEWSDWDWKDSLVSAIQYLFCTLNITTQHHKIKLFMNETMFAVEIWLPAMKYPSSTMMILSETYLSSMMMMLRIRRSFSLIEKLKS